MTDESRPERPKTTTVPLPLKSMDFRGFRCKPPGVTDEIGEYLTGGDAHRDQLAGISRTYLVFEKESDELVGFYTLLADAIRLADGECAEPGAYQSAPAIKIARLGVSHEMQGRGIGGALVDEIMAAYVYPIARQIGVRYITLDAVPDKIDFHKYKGFVFTEIEPQPSTEADKTAGERSMKFDLGDLEMRGESLEKDVPVGRRRRLKQVRRLQRRHL